MERKLNRKFILIIDCYYRYVALPVASLKSNSLNIHKINKYYISEKLMCVKIRYLNAFV